MAPSVKEKIVLFSRRAIREVIVRSLFALHAREIGRYSKRICTYVWKYRRKDLKIKKCQFERRRSLGIKFGGKNLFADLTNVRIRRKIDANIEIKIRGGREKNLGSWD